MFGIPTRGLTGPNMCRDARVFHPRDERTRRRHVWYSSPRMIGSGVSVGYGKSVVVCTFGYEIKESKCSRQQDRNRGSVFGSEARVPRDEQSF